MFLYLLVCAGCSHTPSPEDLDAELKRISQISVDGDHDSALNEVDYIIQTNPTSQKARRLKIEILLRKSVTEKKDGRRESLEKALELQKELTEEANDKWYSHYHLALIYLEYLREPENAIAPLEKARELNPEQYNVLRALVRAYQGVKRYDEAIETCLKIHEITTADPWADNTLKWLRSQQAEKQEQQKENTGETTE